MMPNTAVNRTRGGMPPLGFISFWPKSVLPLRAGYLKLQGLPHLSSNTWP